MRPVSTPPQVSRPSPLSTIKKAVAEGKRATGKLLLKATSYAPSRAPRTEGVKDHWMDNLPAWLRMGIAGGAASIGRGARNVIDSLAGKQYAAPGDPGHPRARAEVTWGVIEHHYALPGLKGFFAETESGMHPATVWPHGQAIAAALDIAELSGDFGTVDSVMKSLSAYETGGAYAPGVYATDASKRLWDDNAWIGLDFMQAFQQTGNRDYLRAAEALFPFMKEGLHEDGGLYWQEDNDRMTRNTCGNAPAIQMAVRLYQATQDTQYLDYAKNLTEFMNSELRSPEGLYYDNLADDGKLDKMLFTYNQGAAVGANALMYQATKDPSYLELAKETANAALEHFGKDDRLWKSSPAFNAIFFRNLLLLDTVAPDPRYRQALEAHVDRIWDEGRDPETGFLNQGGIGKYDPPGLLDQAGFAQMNALLAWPKERLALIA